MNHPADEEAAYFYGGEYTRQRDRHENAYSFLFSQRIRDWPEVLDAARAARSAWAGSIVQRTDTVSHAVRLIAAQFASDFSDLLADIDQGRGRSAIRTARSMMEHAINLASVLRDPEEAERYVAHLDLAYILAEDILPVAFHDWIPGNMRRELEHRLKVEAREPRQRFAEALNKYGRSFRRSWSSKNLHDRAADQGVSGMYDLYRIASLTAHGSAGATLNMEHSSGSYKSFILGSDLKQASLGYLMGMFSVFSVDWLMEDAGIEADWEHVTAATQPLVDRWGVYWWMTNEYDSARRARGLEQLPPTILAVSRSGATRWFIEQPSAQQWQQGRSPALTSEEVDLVARISASLKDHACFEEEPHAQWIALRMPYTEAPVPNMSVPPIPSSAIELLPLAAIALWHERAHREFHDEIEEVNRLGDALGMPLLSSIHRSET